jgi:hypothetical protein
MLTNQAHGADRGAEKSGIFVTIQPMPLRVRKPLSGVIWRSKIGVETITIHPKIDIPDKGMSRKTFSDILLCAKHLLSTVIPHPG